MKIPAISDPTRVIRAMLAAAFSAPDPGCTPGQVLSIAEGTKHMKPEIPDYAEAYASFSAEAVERRALSGSLLTGTNVCVECCDRHAEDADRPALHWISRDWRSRTYGFAELRALSARFANLLRASGIGPGDRVAGLLPRIPELLVVVLGTWRAGAVYQPLFTALGTQAIEHRLATAGTSLVVTDAANRPKLRDIAACPPVLTVSAAGRDEGTAGSERDFWAETEAQPSEFAPVPRRGEDPFLMLFTSGTTGRAKGVAVPLQALLSYDVYMREGLDLRPEDVYWNMADPGWAYGFWFAVLGPLMLGHATMLCEAPFSAETTWRVVRERGVTNLAGAPTAFRMLMAAGAEAAAGLRGQLRAISSAGEPLNPEVIRWAEAVLGCPIRDHYGQTELGMAICNHHGLAHPYRPGTTGLAVPGYRLAVLDDAQREVPPGTPGVLALDRAGSPLFWFRGYWNSDTPNFVDGWYLTGDSVRRDADGTFTFVGRRDDIITSAGYRIGPFEVESALIEHPAVAEAAVVGRPDPERTEVVVAHVVLKPGAEGSPRLAGELQELVRRRVGAHAYPRAVEFVAELPKTPSGKIQRHLLRAGTQQR